MSYEASCHCGAVTLSINADRPDKAIRCNCSHCAIKGLVLSAVPGEAVDVTRGEDALTTYQFNKKVIEHRFCETCGVQPYARGQGQDGQPMAMINLRAVPGMDLEALEIQEFDGASV